ncbi:MAG TPA: PadR family transcriptional regulator [Thermoanaerobaculia bacterium]|jgi:transcriptional regulator|nr:PadR family transcriptional regulator [Thermoanaerobaculia bacterium]
MAAIDKKLAKELRKGSADLLILALLEERPRHGYEIGRLIDQRSSGALAYHVASLYPTLYRLAEQGFIDGRWVERAGQRRRRYYKLTARGRRRLASERSIWQQFFLALDRVANFRQAALEEG